MISEVAAKLKEALDEALPHIEKMDEAQAKADAAKALLDSTVNDLDQAKASLAGINDDLEKKKGELQSTNQQVDDAHARALVEVKRQLADAETKLATLTDAIEKKQAAHDQVVASMNSLAKRLNLS